MSLNQAIRTARAMNIEGRHLQNCFISEDARQRGWKLIQRAKRIFRRLNLNPNLL